MEQMNITNFKITVTFFKIENQRKLRRQEVKHSHNHHRSRKGTNPLYDHMNYLFQQTRVNYSRRTGRGGGSGTLYLVLPTLSRPHGITSQIHSTTEQGAIPQVITYVSSLSCGENQNPGDGGWPRGAPGTAPPRRPVTLVPRRGVKDTHSQNLALQRLRADPAAGAL